jgi:hypothetical protein
MFSAPTTYRTGTRSVEVLPGESHSDAWAYVVRGVPEPVSYPCASRGGGGRVRVRVHASRRRHPHRRRRPASVA